MNIVYMIQTAEENHLKNPVYIPDNTFFLILRKCIQPVQNLVYEMRLKWSCSFKRGHLLSKEQGLLGGVGEWRL